MAALNARFEELESAEWWVKRESRSALAARLRLELRLEWDAERAEALLLGNTREFAMDDALVTWLRGLYASQDADGYLAMLRRHAQAPSSSPELLRETLAEIEERYGEDGATALIGLLDNASTAVRVEAALALVRLDLDEEALPALCAVAADTSLRRPTRVLSRDWPRWNAIAHLIESGDWDVRRMRAQVTAKGEDGLVIERLDKALSAESTPLTDVERREIYRDVLNGPHDGGVLVAIAALVKLDDRPSYERMRAIVEEMADPAPDGERDAIGSWHRRRTLPELLDALDR